MKVNSSTVEVYLTSTIHDPEPTKEDDMTPDKEDADGIEMSERENLLAAANSEEGDVAGFEVTHGRPDIPGIVEETMVGSHGQVAVLFCGPEEMRTQLEKCVGKWVKHGAGIYWHAEHFGY